MTVTDTSNRQHVDSGPRRLWLRATAAPLIAGGAALVLTGCLPEPTSPSPASDREPSPATTGQVVHIVDGDTADVRLTDGTQVRVRVLGIDTPETVKPGTPVQCWGPEASAWAHRILDATQVTLTSDPAASDTDKYGRSLRYLTLPDGSDYSVLAAEAGMAQDYRADIDRIAKGPDILSARNAARTQGAGMWGPPCNTRQN